jgi:hypothetical protein
LDVELGPTANRQVDLAPWPAAGPLDDLADLAHEREKRPEGVGLGPVAAFVLVAR